MTVLSETIMADPFSARVVCTASTLFLQGCEEATQLTLLRKPVTVHPHVTLYLCTQQPVRTAYDNLRRIRMSVQVGQTAPDFTLKNTDMQDVTLSAFRGQKNVVLLFVPLAFTGVCTNE